ncbi:AAA family ATPase [Aliarcobacter butzleri]|uniref:AAA family ATPase n=1 Tax=Aliarcobacter butzleri TaxID=28197 RepID=UPI00125F6578|nr:AAA family ATPase [Aliarcobacter butzleri]
MKIVLTGGSSTGKSSLANELYRQKIVQNLLYVNIKQIIIEMGYNNIDDMNGNVFLEFQKRIFLQREILEDSLDNYVSDRGFIDGLAYLMAKNIDSKPFIKKYMKNILQYDYIFYLPGNCIPYQHNNFRSHSTYFNKLVDTNIKKLLLENNIKYYTLNEPNFDKRIKEIKDIISING